MIWKNVYFHNVASLVTNEDGSVSWRRVPDYVYDNLAKGEHSKIQASNATGVEMRFILKGENAKITISADGEGAFHIYRGSIQGRWQDEFKYVTSTQKEFIIDRCEKEERLKIMKEKCDYPFSWDVVRIIFDRGHFKIHNIEGDIVPATKENFPKKTILTYGSSITHGSNALDSSHTWASVLAHNLKMDVRNLGMAGCCIIENEFANYIAKEGEEGKWDIAILELGINVLLWEEEKIYEKVTNIINQVAGRNKDKKVFVISPFYHCGDDFLPEKNGDKWRRIIKEIIEELKHENVTYINGLDVLDNMEYMSADFVHPNIYGAMKIAHTLTQIIKEKI
ncbi:MAG: hypothetical protein E7391_02505 [Ruminococcaceae bacterium]|nr:hypothetical protein [Oscillospiraceae bacterium]